MGGFSKAPKFPQPVNFNFLFTLYAANPKDDKAKQALKMALHTLEMMAKGGIHDHISQVQIRSHQSKHERSAIFWSAIVIDDRFFAIGSRSSIVIWSKDRDRDSDLNFGNRAYAWLFTQFCPSVKRENITNHVRLTLIIHIVRHWPHEYFEWASFRALQRPFCGHCFFVHLCQLVKEPFLLWVHWVPRYCSEL